MNRFARFLGLTAASLLSHVVSAQADGVVPAGEPFAWTLTPAVVSQYMFRGVRLGGLSFQPQVEADGRNLDFGVWSNVPLAAKVAGQSDPEIDLYGSGRFVLNDALSVQPGFTWYTYANAKPDQGFYRTTFEPNVAVNYVGHGISLTPKVYYDVVLDGPTFELNGSYALPLKSVGTELDLNATLGTYKWKRAIPDRNPALKSWGDYWLIGATVPYQISRTSKVSLGFAYTRGSGNYFKQGRAPKVRNEAAGGRGVVTLGYAITF